MAKTQLPKNIDELKPWERNPRAIDDAAAQGLKASIERFGDIGGITFNARTQRLVCGHQRVKQLIELGAILEHGEGLIWIRDSTTSERFMVRVVDWDETTEAEANISANNQYIAGEFTDDLSLVLSEIRQNDERAFESLRLEPLGSLSFRIDSPEESSAQVSEPKEIAPPEEGEMSNECPRCGYRF